MTKRMLKGQVHGYSRSPSELDGGMDEVIQRLVSLKAEAEAHGFTNLRIEVGYGYSGDDVDWTIMGDRLETDQEYDARLRAEDRLRLMRQKDKLSKEQKERKEYERLRRKFEKKGKKDDPR